MCRSCQTVHPATAACPPNKRHRGEDGQARAPAAAAASSLYATAGAGASRKADHAHEAARQERSNVQHSAREVAASSSPDAHAAAAASSTSAAVAPGPAAQPFAPSATTSSAGTAAAASEPTKTPRLLQAPCPVCVSATANQEPHAHAVLSEHSLENHLDPDEALRRMEWHQHIQCTRCHHVRWRVKMTDWYEEKNNEDDDSELSGNSASLRVEEFFIAPADGPPLKDGSMPIANAEIRTLFSSDERGGVFLPFSSQGEASLECLPPAVQRLMLEIQAAAASESWCLWTMGLRMLIELVLSSSGVRFTTLNDAIKTASQAIPAEVPQKYLAQLQGVLQELHNVRLYGNAAAHSADAVPLNQRASVFQHVRRLLNLMYFIPLKYKELDAQVSNIAAAAGDKQGHHPKYKPSP